MLAQARLSETAMPNAERKAMNRAAFICRQLSLDHPEGDLRAALLNAAREIEAEVTPSAIVPITGEIPAERANHSSLLGAKSDNAQDIGHDDKSARLQRYTFERAGDGWQFVTTTDGKWVMAKDVELLERELAAALETKRVALHELGDCERVLNEQRDELAEGHRICADLLRVNAGLRDDAAHSSPKGE